MSSIVSADMESLNDYQVAYIKQVLSEETLYNRWCRWLVKNKKVRYYHEKIGGSRYACGRYIKTFWFDVDPLVNIIH